MVIAAVDNIPTAAKDIPYKPSVALSLPPPRKYAVIIPIAIAIIGTAVDIIPTASPPIILVDDPVSDSLAILRTKGKLSEV